MQTIETGVHPIKAWVDGVPFEDQARLQLERLARLPFIHSHLAVMPDVHPGRGATVGSVIPTKGAIIPAAVGVDIGCFVGETKIPLLDGTQATLRDLAEKNDSFWVYSIDHKTLKTTPGRAIAQKTRSNASLIRITVSGGDEIVCTPDHPFMLSDGSYRQAKDLKFNDSLMPLYRRWDTRDGYESVSNGKGTQAHTHRMVWEALYGKVADGYVIHHKNVIHFDNRPENLKLMSISEHSAHHRKIGKKLDNSSSTFQEKRMAGILRRATDTVSLSKMKAVGTANIIKYMKDQPEHYAESTRNNGKRGAKFLSKFNTTPRNCEQCNFIAENPAILFWHEVKNHNKAAPKTHSNHKVIKAEHLNYTEDVYCLQVEEHNNFALAAGVFVHNCGMSGVRTSLKAEDLPDSLVAIREALERTVPVGGAKHERVPASVDAAWKNLGGGLGEITRRHQRISDKNAREQLGTMGGGNHFIEVTIDEAGHVWLVVHSGSRGIGNRIGEHFIERARREIKRLGIGLEDSDLSYITEGTNEFEDYVAAVGWAQDYARENRRLMGQRCLDVLRERRMHLQKFKVIDQIIDVHHNYVAREEHFGEKIWVTRKGAVRAGLGDLGIIPGSMGARSYIVRGLGNPESFQSCSHGAGRRMDRGDAKNSISMSQFKNDMKGIEARVHPGVVDEAPAAYKDIEAVMAAQSDLVEIVHQMRQVVVIKG